MTYKMKGFGGFGNSPAKQEGPISKKNIKLQKGEMEGTWIYPGSDKSERIIDYEDRAEFARHDAESSEAPERKNNPLFSDEMIKKEKDHYKKKKEMHLKTAKNLQHEADIIRNRKPNKK